MFFISQYCPITTNLGLMAQQAQYIYLLIKTLPFEEQDKVFDLLRKDFESSPKKKNLIPFTHQKGVRKKKEPIITIEETKMNLLKTFGCFNQ